MKAVCWSLLLVACVGAAKVQPSEAASDDAARAAFVAWARQNAVRLPSCSADTDVAAFGGAASIVGNARVVALGEPAHGAHEPLALRNCLFRYLVERHGFTAIALESGLSESRRLQGYLAGGPGDVHQVAREGLTWGFSRFAENVELIAWIRRYNADASHQQKIRIYGIDLSGGERSGEWRNARITLDAAVTYLARNAAPASERVRAAVEPFLDRFTLPAYAALPPPEREKLRSAIDGLIHFFDREQTHLIEAGGKDDYAWARRNAVLARQVEALFSVSRPASDDDSLGPDDYRADAARDAAMAANVRWVLEREGAGRRIMLFAHNGHVANASTRGGIWSVYKHPPMSMGQHLRAALGKSLLILPISSASNGPGLPPDAGRAGTVDAALAATGLERFLVDIRTAGTTAPAAWLAQDQTIRTNFATESILSPKVAFDGLVFIARLTPAAKADE